MKRREIITLLAGAALAYPLAARSQPSGRMRRIAVMMSNAEGDPEGESRAAALRQGLQELGWMEGQNLRIDWFWSGADRAYVRAYAAQLASAAPDLIVANGTVNLDAVRQAMRATPVVFVVVNDPVGQGFISSLARPGGNITGFTFVEYSMFGKSLELLKQAAPGIAGCCACAAIGNAAAAPPSNVMNWRRLTSIMGSPSGTRWASLPQA